MSSRLFCVDTHFEGNSGTCASYLILAPNNKAAIVETGAAPGLPFILEALECHHIPRENVLFVAVTHVHLDHCGGVGALLDHLPSAKALVHPRGAPHLIDPRRLIDAATAVHGVETLRRHYGCTQPVAADRVVPSEHRQKFLIDENAGIVLEALHSPGHAPHHMFLALHERGDEPDRAPQCRYVFTGDGMAASYPWMRSTDGAMQAFVAHASPPQFDGAAWRASLDLIDALRPAFVCPTHYGPAPYSPSLIQEIRETLDAYAALVTSAQSVADLPPVEFLADRVFDLVAAVARRHGFAAPADFAERMRPDTKITAEGLLVWRTKQLQQPH